MHHPIILPHHLNVKVIKAEIIKKDLPKDDHSDKRVALKTLTHLTF